MELVARILAIVYSGILILLVPFDIYFLIVVTYARQVINQRYLKHHRLHYFTLLTIPVLDLTRVRHDEQHEFIDQQSFDQQQTDS